MILRSALPTVGRTLDRLWLCRGEVSFGRLWQPPSIWDVATLHQLQHGCAVIWRTLFLMQQAGHWASWKVFRWGEIHVMKGLTTSLLKRAHWNEVFLFLSALWGCSKKALSSGSELAWVSDLLTPECQQLLKGSSSFIQPQVCSNQTKTSYLLCNW